MAPIALQIYTLRELAEVDLPGTLRTVADIGYKGIEFAGLYGHEPGEIASLIKDLGLEVCGSHTAIPEKDTVQQIADAELSLDNHRIILGLGPNDINTLDDCRKAAEMFESAAELMKPYGITVSVHNHWFEFNKIGDRYVYDIVMDQAPNVLSELDIYWAAYGGADAIEITMNYRDRIELLHVKDGPLEGLLMDPIGSGKLDIPAIVNACDPGILKWSVVELDDVADNMLDAVKESYRYLASSGLATGNRISMELCTDVCDAVGGRV